MKCHNCDFQWGKNGRRRSFCNDHGKGFNRLDSIGNSAFLKLGFSLGCGRFFLEIGSNWGDTENEIQYDFLCFLCEHLGPRRLRRLNVSKCIKLLRDVD